MSSRQITDVRGSGSRRGAEGSSRNRSEIRKFGYETAQTEWHALQIRNAAALWPMLPNARALTLVCALARHLTHNTAKQSIQADTMGNYNAKDLAL